MFNDSAQHIVPPLGSPVRPGWSGPGGCGRRAMEVVAPSQRKNWAALRAKVAAAAQRKVSVAAAAQWRLPPQDNGGTWPFRIMAVLLPRAEQRLAASLRISVGLRSRSSASAQHSGISHLNLKRIPTSI